MTEIKMDSRFLACLPYTLKQEMLVYTGTPADWSNHRNFDNDPDDPGGATQCGIIQTEYTRWRKHQGLPPRSVRLITDEEGKAIYYTGYWVPECPKLPAGLDLSFFDEAVNAGPHAATLLLQGVLRLHADGEWGPATEAAVAAIKTDDVVGLVKSFAAAREVRYRHTRNFWKFGKDWMRRAQEIEKASLWAAATVAATSQHAQATT